MVKVQEMTSEEWQKEKKARDEVVRQRAASLTDERVHKCPVPELVLGLETTARAFHTVWCQPHGRGIFRDCDFDSCVRARALIKKAKECES